MKMLVKFSIAAILLSSCHKENTNTIESDYIELIPAVSVGATVESTKAPVYVPDMNMGMCIFPVSATLPTAARDSYFKGYDNVGGSSWAGGWVYWLQGTTFTTPNLGIFRVKGGFKTYAFSPRNEIVDGTNLDKIPFTTGTTNASNIDYMVANPYTSPTDLSGISSLTMPLQMNHIMTAVTCTVLKNYVGPFLVRDITVKFQDASGNPKNVVGMKGTFSVLDAKVTPTIYSDSLNVLYSYYYTDPVGVASFYLIFPEVISSLVGASLTGTKMIVTVYFENARQQLLSGSYTVDLSTLTFGSGDFGLQRGKQYLFNVNVDNYVKFVGPPQIGDWDPTVINKDIEI